MSAPKDMDMLAVEPKKKHKKKKSSRAGSEAASESTMTPDKFANGSPGSVHSLPVRGVMPSMVGSGVRGRSVVSYYG